MIGVAYCKKVTVRPQKKGDEPFVILGKVSTVEEGNTTFKEIETGSGKKYRFPVDRIDGIVDTNEIFMEGR